LVIPRRSRWFIAVCSLTLCTCGSDDNSDNTGGGEVHTGTSVEGSSCSVDDECLTGLSCMVGQVVRDRENNAATVNVCARKCERPSGDCGQDEECLSPAVDSSQAYPSLCMTRLAPGTFAACGAKETAACTEGEVCLPVYAQSQELLGSVCVQLCQLGSQADQDQAACAEGLSCRSVLTDTTEYGACMRSAARAAECGVLQGEACSDADYCVSDGSTAHCVKNCREDKTCDAGQTCTALADDRWFCK